MSDSIRHWEMARPGEPLVPGRRPRAAPGAGEALVRVAGCGVCHTDVGFHLGQVRTKHPLPLVLGHEISGIVEEAGPGAGTWTGKPVVVPAILPCGDCPACRRGRYALCPAQVFPGNDVHGGFATHVTVPARFLCDAGAAEGAALARLSVVADAVSTPFEAIARSGLGAGDLAVVVGAGGVGGFAVQIAAALGAAVAVVEPSEPRRRLALAHGASLALDPAAAQAADLRKALRGFARERRLPEEEWRIFEMSGTPAGQETAFGLMVRGSYLGIVGFAAAKVSVPLSHLMALDARAVGSWGCDPARYPQVLDLIARGKVLLEPFVEQRPLSQVNEVLAAMVSGHLDRRVVLVPDFA